MWVLQQCEPARCSETLLTRSSLQAWPVFFREDDTEAKGNIPHTLVYFSCHCWNVPLHPGCSTRSLVNSFHTGYQLTSHILFHNRFFYSAKLPASTLSDPFNRKHLSVCLSPHTASPLDSSSSIYPSWPFARRPLAVSIQFTAQFPLVRFVDCYKTLEKHWKLSMMI